jgi:Flp pilus assembly protein TadD
MCTKFPLPSCFVDCESPIASISLVARLIAFGWLCLMVACEPQENSRPSIDETAIATATSERPEAFHQQQLDSALRDAARGDRLVTSREFVAAILPLTNAAEFLVAHVDTPGVDLSARWQLANAMTNLGRCFAASQEFRSAELNFRKSLSIKSDLISRSPDGPSRWKQIAQDYLDFGQYYQRRGDLRNAKECFYESIRWRRQFLGVTPRSSKAKLDLARSCAACARVLEVSARGIWNQEAAAVYSRSYELLKNLMEDDSFRASAFAEYYLLTNDYIAYLQQNEVQPLVATIGDDLQKLALREQHRPTSQQDPVRSRLRLALLHLLGQRTQSTEPQSESTESVRHDSTSEAELTGALSGILSGNPPRQDLLDAQLAWEYVEGCHELARLLAIPRSATAGDLDLAVKLATIAVKRDPASARYWTTLGLAQFRSGHDSEAITAIQRALATPCGDNFLNHLLLAMSYYRSGEMEKSKAHSQDAEDFEKGVVMLGWIRQLRSEATELFTSNR